MDYCLRFFGNSKKLIPEPVMPYWNKIMENKDIGISDFEIVCRICLDKKENMTSMFEKSLLPNLIKTYREMLEDCASVHISTDDSLPKQICLECIKYLEQSYKFKIQYLSTEKLLEQIITNAQPNIKVEVSIDEDDDFKNEDESFNYYSHFIFNQEKSNEIPLNETTTTKEFITVKEESKDTNKEVKDTKKEEKDTKRELKNINKEFKDNVLKDCSAIQKYKCEECETGFELKADFYKHQKLVHSKILKCLHCDKTFEFTYYLIKHSPEVVQCKICKQDFGCNNNLRAHAREHTTCKICGKNFKSIRSCNRHIATHGDKRYLCTYCGKAFADSTNYIVHVRRHTGEKPYQCNLCDAKFCDSNGLQIHSVKHSDERKYECDTCKKTFKTKDAVAKHKRSHVEEKNYSCDICNKSFRRKDNLRDHEKIHTGERNYICTYCNKAFMKSDNLKMHLRVHTGEKPYSCGKCGKSYSQKHALNSHMKTHLENCLTNFISQ